MRLHTRLLRVDIAILAGIAGIAGIAGTGITHIQNHYLYPNEGMHWGAGVRNIVTDREGAFRD